MPKNPCTYSVIILGAGPAGLTAAYLLAKAGTDVLVIEKDSQYLGGLARTTTALGCYFDMGAHRFFTPFPEVKLLWDEWLPGGFLKRERLTRIFYSGKYFNYPLEPVEAFRKLGFLESFRCAISLLASMLFKTKPEISFKDWVCNRFGKRLFSIFFKSYTEKVWGMKTDEISKDWASQRIRNVSPISILVNSIRSSQLIRGRGRQDEVERSFVSSFLYPKKGPGMLWEACAKQALVLGANIQQGFEPIQISFENNEWELKLKKSNGEISEVRCETLISSMAMGELVSLLVPQPTVETQRAATSLKYRGLIVANVILSGEELFPDNWIYVHEMKVKVGRITNYRAMSPEMLPNDHTQSYGMEYFCNEGDPFWGLQEEEVAEIARRELVSLKLCKEDRIRAVVIERNARAYPVYDHEYLANVREIRNEIATKFPSLHLIGRNGMHKYNNQDHSMLTAIKTVENILSGLNSCDPWETNSSEGYIEEATRRELHSVSGERLVPQWVNFLGSTESV